MAFETESGEVTGIYIKGPFFTGNPDAREKPSRYLSMQLTKDVEDTLQEALEQLPVLSASATTRLAQMLHYCVRGEKIAPQPDCFLCLPAKAGKDKRQGGSRPVYKSRRPVECGAGAAGKGAPG